MTDAADALLDDLRDHNPWWERGADAFSLPARHKSDFYHLARPDKPDSQFEDQPLLALVGRRGAGKTTLLQQFIHHRIETGDDPTRFLYLPFDADPRYQLKSDDQLRRVVRYYENRILGRGDTDGPHFLILDDVHRIEHPNKTIDGWGTPVADLLDATSGRHIAVTASAGIQIERELERVGLANTAYTVQPILPEKFRDFVFTQHPELEADEATRISPSSLRTGDSSIPTALETGDTNAFVAELRAKHEQVAAVDRRIQSRVLDYLVLGGSIAYAHSETIDSATDLPASAYADLRDDIRDALYQEIPGFESIKTIDDLERLCALAARNAGAEPIQYNDLVDLFDVDRRTIADRYLPALAELFILTGITEYDNQRPRAVRLYLRDTGLVTALSDGDPASLHSDFEREATLARVAAFDHTMRFAYGINAAHGNTDAPSVQYWRNRTGEVDFVFEVNDTPLPVGLAYRRPDRGQTITALRAFTETYDTPLALLLVGDTARGEPPITQLEDGIVTLPYWLYLLLC